jgi:hypothetical protein
VLPLGFRFDVDAVIVDGFAHRADCQQLPRDLPPDAVGVAIGGIHHAERCPRECPRCHPPFETLLTHELERPVATLMS